MLRPLLNTLKESELIHRYLEADGRIPEPVCLRNYSYRLEFSISLWQTTMRQALTTLIIIGLAGATLYLAPSFFGSFVITIAAISLLTVSYFLRYLRGLLGVELAYWGLIYAAFAIILLGVGLLQSHAGCLFLFGDCYQPSLPSWLMELKIALGIALRLTNIFAIIMSILNLYRTFSKEI